MTSEANAEAQVAAELSQQEGASETDAAKNEPEAFENRQEAVATASDSTDWAQAQDAVSGIKTWMPPPYPTPFRSTTTWAPKLCKRPKPTEVDGPV
jgi:hypothetical protein